MTADQPLISVVIPTYNHACYLGRALRSLLEQSYSRWEAIVVDNHSTDDTDQVLSSFSDPRIRAVKVNNNGVIAVSRNKGIDLARGEWIAFLDSDDWWLGDKLQRCVAAVGPEVDLIHHTLTIVTDPQAMVTRGKIDCWQLRSPALIDLLLRGNALATSSVLVRTAVLKRTGGFDESREMVACEDYNLWLRIAAATEKFTYLPISLGFYLDNEKGMSRRDMSVPCRYATEEFMLLLTARQRDYFAAKLHYLKGRHAYLNSNWQVALGALRASMQDGPWLNRLKALVMCVLLYLRAGK